MLLKNLFSKVLLILALYLYLSNSSTAYANSVFTDTLLGGYKSDWIVASYGPPPNVTLSGITGSSTTLWSGLLLPIMDNNVYYKIQFDISVNNANSSAAWGTSIRNASFNQYKLVNIWGQYQLQIHETVGLDTLVNWDHTNGIHHIVVIVSPQPNTDFIIYDNNNQIGKFTTTLSFSAGLLEIGVIGIGDYVLSNFALSEEPFSSITPAPSLSPTPIPTPIPTPPPVKKVIILPGLGGSWNADALLHCKADNYDGSWGPWNIANLTYDYYDPLKNLLASQHFEPKIFYYDWRKQIPATTSLLTDYINSTDLGLVSNEKIDIVGHSLGGLIGRSYIETERFNNKADKYLSVGAPHQGTLLAYPPWSAGEVWGNLIWKMAATVLLKSCPSNISNREIVRRFIPSVQNILPVKDYLKDKKTGNAVPVGSMNVQNNFPMAEFMTDYNTGIGALAGVGFNTLQFFDVNNEGKKTTGNWIDGKPKDSEYFDGDGTVLKESSALYNHTKTLNLDHTGLIASDQGVQEILYFLSTGHFSGSTAVSATYVEPKSALLVIGDPANFWVLDPNNKLVESKESQTAFINPKSGFYRLILNPKTSSTRIVVAQFLENGQTLWKEYKHEGMLPKIGTIKFDTNNPVEDALK